MSIAYAAPSERDILVALRTFLLSLLPTGVEIIQGQDNRVAEPLGDDFIVMTPMPQTRMSTNIDTLDPETGLSVTITASMQIGVQLDIHGPNSSANAMLVALLWRDSYAGTAVDSSVVAPLYADDPHQAPFLNAENQYETRWVMMVYLQANPVVTAPQDSATSLAIELYEADQ